MFHIQLLMKRKYHDVLEDLSTRIIAIKGKKNAEVICA